MARREPELRRLQQRFVCLRMVKMNGVDLGQFQFDFDMTWAALFLNADGTVYARYGSRNVDGPMVTNRVQGLVATMRRVLKAHETYPANRVLFESKRGPMPRHRRPESYPYLKDRRGVRRVRRGNCIHCHNVHEAMLDMELGGERGGKAPSPRGERGGRAPSPRGERGGRAPSPRPRPFYPYPFPENVGLRLDPDSGIRVQRVLESSPAQRAGLRSGDLLSRARGEAIFSIADLQFVLHHLGPEVRTLPIEVRRAGEIVAAELRLADGWRLNDFSWRVSRSAYPPDPGLYLRLLRAKEREKLGLPAGRLALEVKGLFSEMAQASGLREGDLVVGIDGRRDEMSGRQFQDYLRVKHFLRRSKATLKVLRDGREVAIEAQFFSRLPGE